MVGCLINKASPLERPYIPDKMLFLDAVASGFGSLVGGIFGSSGQKSANKTNLQIARETNEQNYKMFQEQLGWNEQMLKKQNEYNTPEAQMERYREAGINPYLAMDNTSSGNAEAVQSASPNAAVPGAPMQNESAALGDALGKVVPQAIDVISQSLSNKEKAIDLLSRQELNDANLNKLRNEGKLNDSQALYYSSLNDKIVKSLPKELQLLDENIGLTQAHTKEAAAHAELLDLQKKLSDYDLNFIKPAELREINRRIWKMAQDVAIGRVNAASAAKSAAAAVISANASALDAKTRSKQYEKLKDAMEDEIRSRAALNYWNASPEADFDVELSSDGGDLGIPGFGSVQVVPGAKVRAKVRTRKGR